MEVDSQQFTNEEWYLVKGRLLDKIETGEIICASEIDQYLRNNKINYYERPSFMTINLFEISISSIFNEQKIINLQNYSPMEMIHVLCDWDLLRGNEEDIYKTGRRLLYGPINDNEKVKECLNDAIEFLLEYVPSIQFFDSRKSMTDYYTSQRYTHLFYNPDDDDFIIQTGVKQVNETRLKKKKSLIHSLQNNLVDFPMVIINTIAEHCFAAYYFHYDENDYICDGWDYK